MGYNIKVLFSSVEMNFLKLLVVLQGKLFHTNLTAGVLEGLDQTVIKKTCGIAILQQHAVQSSTLAWRAVGSSRSQ